MLADAVMQNFFCIIPSDVLPKEEINPADPSENVKCVKRPLTPPQVEEKSLKERIHHRAKIITPLHDKYLSSTLVALVYDAEDEILLAPSTFVVPRYQRPLSSIGTRMVFLVVQ